MSCKLHNVRFYNCEPKAIYCMAVECESKILALSRSDAHIELWDISSTPYMIRTIPGTPKGSIEALGWFGPRLFSTGLSGALVEWDIKTLIPKKSTLLTGQAGWCLDVTKSLNKIAVGTEQGYLNIFTIEENSINFERIFDKQEGRILCCKFDPKGQVLVTGSIETIRIWNVSTGQALHRMSTGRLEKNKETIVWCLAVTSDLTIISGDSRLCGQNGETLRHILSGCSVLAGNEYLERHNQVAKILHQKIALKYKLIDNELPYYQYKPLSVLENSAAKLYWDRPILTDRTIPANRPDIVLVDHSKNTTYIVDVTIPHDENLQKAERDKILKYMDLAHEIKDMWRTPATIVVPIVISTNGLIPKNLHANLCKVGVDGGLKYLMQKAVLLSTCRTLRRLTFWDGNMGEQLESMTTHKCDILSVCLSEDESSVYCAGVDPLIVSVARVKIKHRSEQGHVDKWVKSIKRNIHSHDVRTMVTYKNRLFSGGVDSYLAVSSYPPKMLVKYPPLQHPVAKFSAKARLVCLRYINYLEIWKLGSAKSDKDGQTHTYVMEDNSRPNPVNCNGAGMETENGYSREDSRSKTRRLQLSERATMLVKLNTSSCATLTCCDISPDGQWVAYSTDSHLRIFELSQDKDSPELSKVIDLPEECTPCYKMSFSPDSTSLITSTADSTLKFFHVDRSNGITHSHTVSGSNVLKDVSLVHMYISEFINRGYYIVLGDSGGSVAMWRMLCNGKGGPTIAGMLPKYSSVPTAMTIDSNCNLLVVYADQKIVEYSLKHSRLTEFHAHLQHEKYGLGSKWYNRMYPILSAHYHPSQPNVILMNDDSGVYVINKNAETKGVVPKKAKMVNGDFHSKVTYTTLKKLKHVVTAQWIEDDQAVLVIVEPDTLIEKLPPAFIKERFGVM